MICLSVSAAAVCPLHPASPLFPVSKTAEQEQQMEDSTISILSVQNINALILISFKVPDSGGVTSHMQLPIKFQK